MKQFCKSIVLLGIFLTSTQVFSQEPASISLEFEGRFYSTFEEIGAIIQAGGVSDFEVHCGFRATLESIARGPFLPRNEQAVCFRTEAEIRNLLAESDALRDLYFPLPGTSPVFPPVLQHRVCTESPRGTPFSYPFYNTAWDDVCPPYPRGTGRGVVRSYWQVGSGKTTFYFAPPYQRYHWWLNASRPTQDGMMPHSISYYEWGN